MTVSGQLSLGENAVGPLGGAWRDRMHRCDQNVSLSPHDFIPQTKPNSVNS
jgi:hypothetical protein